MATRAPPPAADSDGDAAPSEEPEAEPPAAGVVGLGAVAPAAGGQQRAAGAGGGDQRQHVPAGGSGLRRRCAGQQIRQGLVHARGKRPDWSGGSAPSPPSRLVDSPAASRRAMSCIMPRSTGSGSTSPKTSAVPDPGPGHHQVHPPARTRRRRHRRRSPGRPSATDQPDAGQRPAGDERLERRAQPVGRPGRRDDRRRPRRRPTCTSRSCRRSSVTSRAKIDSPPAVGQHPVVDPAVPRCVVAGDLDRHLLRPGPAVRRRELGRDLQLVPDHLADQGVRRVPVEQGVARAVHEDVAPVGVDARSRRR